MSQLFEQTHPGAQLRPARNNATETRDMSYLDIRAELPVARRKYLDCLARICRRGQRTKRGKVIRDLTDAEAAALLKWPRSSVCGRRNELSGGSGSPRRFVISPAVVTSEKRTCCVTGHTAQAWKISDQIDLEV